MIKIKVAEASGLVLDWLVAKCEGFDAIYYERRRIATIHRRDDAQPRKYTPTTNLAQGGPIMDRERISFREETPSLYVGFIWNGVQHVEYSNGPTALIAAMRCYVIANLGQEVYVPNEVVDTNL